MKPKIKKTQIKHFTRSEEKRFQKSVEEGSSLRDKLMFDLLLDRNVADALDGVEGDGDD